MSTLAQPSALFLDRVRLLLAFPVVELGARQESRIWKRAKRDLIIPGSHDYSDWFLGTGTSTALPRWSGYTFAYRMVRPYLAAGMTASRAVTIDAESVYAPYRQAHK